MDFQGLTMDFQGMSNAGVAPIEPSSGGLSSSEMSAGEHGRSSSSAGQESFRAASPQRCHGAGRKARPPKLYRIGEVVDYSGMSRQTIHNYTIMGLLRESKWTTGGHRLYDESVFERIDQIEDLKAQHKSIHDIREHFVKLDAT